MVKYLREDMASSSRFEITELARSYLIMSEGFDDGMVISAMASALSTALYATLKGNGLEKADEGVAAVNELLYVIKRAAVAAYEEPVDE